MGKGRSSGLRTRARWALVSESRVSWSFTKWLHINTGPKAAVASQNRASLGHAARTWAKRARAKATFSLVTGASGSKNAAPKR
jgi:hypothetical protein